VTQSPSFHLSLSNYLSDRLLQLGPDSYRCVGYDAKLSTCIFTVSELYFWPQFNYPRVYTYITSWSITQFVTFSIAWYCTHQCGHPIHQNVIFSIAWYCTHQCGHPIHQNVAILDTVITVSWVHCGENFEILCLHSSSFVAIIHWNFKGYLYKFLAIAIVKSARFLFLNFTKKFAGITTLRMHVYSIQMMNDLYLN